MDHSGIAPLIPLLILIIIPFVLLLICLPVIAFWRICDRAGFNGALALLMLVPFGNIILPLYVAFAKWPALEQKSKETT
jgi:hypothetical protein